MKPLRSTSKHWVVAAALGLLALGGADDASAAATAKFTVTNQFGTSITIDTSSCTGGSISPTYSISNGSSATFTGTTTGSSTLCNARYQSGIYGCQFQISANNSGGLFASTNAYKGTGSGSTQRPVCEILYEGSIAGGYEAKFRMR